LEFFTWDKPVLTVYRERQPTPEREPFAVIQTRRLTVSITGDVTIEGKMQDSFVLMGDIDYVSSEEGKNDKYVVCWFDPK